MRFLVVAHPQFPLPPEMMPQVIEGFAEWWERYQNRWNAGFFAGGDGGGGVCEAEDEAALHQMMTEWPLYPFSTLDVHLLLDVEIALDQWRAMAASMAE